MIAIIDRNQAQQDRVGNSVKRAKFFGQSVLTTLLCLSLLIWSASPSYSHVPTIFETIQDHLEMVEDHGHSHGIEEDLYWAMHGHSHVVADHDHIQAFLLTGFKSEYDPATGDRWRVLVAAHGPTRPFLIERPSRA